MNTRYISILTLVSIMIPAIFVNKLAFIILSIVLLYKSYYLYGDSKRYFVISAWISAITGLMMISNVTGFMNMAICSMIAIFCYITSVQSNVIKRNTFECVLVSLILLNITAGLITTDYIIKNVTFYNNSGATGVIESSNQFLNIRNTNDMIKDLNEINTKENNIYNILNTIKDSKEYYSKVDDNKSYNKYDLAIEFMNNMENNVKHSIKDLSNTDLVNRCIHKYKAGNV